jgi:hypothetical protein
MTTCRKSRGLYKKTKTSMFNRVMGEEASVEKATVFLCVAMYV